MLLADAFTNFRITGAIVGLAIIGGAVWFAIRRGKLSFLGVSGEFLCDSCKYSDARYCSRPDRPNAKRCPDYKSVV